jgi:hypothetical protein
MDPFQAIKYVTSGITLVAFLAATIAWVYRYRLKSRKQTIELAEPAARAALVERTLEFFTVDTAGLSNEQKYDLALRQIEARTERFHVSTKAALVVAGIAALITIVFLFKGSGQVPISLVKVDGDGIASILKFHNFVVKAVDTQGNPVAGVKIAWSTPTGGNKAYVDVTGVGGMSTATNLYSFPTPGLYEQVASVATDNTQIGWTTTSASHVAGPTVKFKYNQLEETACADGDFHEENSLTWTYKRDDKTVELKSDDRCWVTFTSPNSWSGKLECNNGLSNPVTLKPNADCSEISSSLSWFKLHK